MCFKENKLDEEKDGFESALGEDIVVALDALKGVYDWGVLTGLLGEHSTISEVKIEQYNQLRDSQIV